MDLWSVQRHPEAFRRPYELWTLCLLSAESSRSGGCHCLHLKTCPRFLSKSFSPHPDALQCVLPRSGCGAWTLVGLIWAFHIAVPATRVKKLFLSSMVLDAKTAWRPHSQWRLCSSFMVLILTRPIRWSENVHTFKAFYLTVVSSFPSSRFCMNVHILLFDFIRSSRISIYLLWASI